MPIVLVYLILILTGLGPSQSFAASAKQNPGASSASLQAAEAISAFSRQTSSTLSRNCGQKDQTCSYILRSLVKSDRENALLGIITNQFKECAAKFPKANDKSVLPAARDLSNHMSQYQFPGLGPVHQSLMNRCLSGDLDQSKESVAKYYYYLERMRKEQAQAVEEVAEIDRILGESQALDGVDCATTSFANVRSRCELLKQSCKAAPGELDRVAQATQSAMAEIKSLEQNIEVLTSGNGKTGKDKIVSAARLSRSDFDQRSKEIEAAQIRIDLLKGQNPWLQGEVFKKYASQGVKKAIAEQLRADRTEHIAGYRQSNYYQTCLSGTVVTKECNPDLMRKFIEDKTPRLSDENPGRGRTPEEALAGHHHVQFQQCLHDAKIDQQKKTEMAVSLAVDAGLTIGTMGAGAVFSVGKAVLSARRLTLAKLGRGISGTIDGGFFAKDLGEAYKVCSATALKGSGVDEGRACQTATPNAGRQVLAATDDCLTQAMMAVLGGVPIATWAAQRMLQVANLSPLDRILLKDGFTHEDLARERDAIRAGKPGEGVVSRNAKLGREERIAKMKQDFPNLKPEQILCAVDRVHTIGSRTGRGVYTYTKTEIMQKARTLRRVCGVNVADTEALMRLGYTGELGTVLDNLLEETSRVLEQARQSARAQITGPKPNLSPEEVAKKTDELRRKHQTSSDPVERLRLRDQIAALQNQREAQVLESHPNLIDEVLESTTQPLAGKPSGRVIEVSGEKLRQLQKQGASGTDLVLIDLRPGQAIPFHSATHGRGVARIQGVDPKNPDHIILEIATKDPNKPQVVSLPQTELAMTDAEKAKMLAEVSEINDAERRANAKLLEQVLNEKPGVNVERVFDDYLRAERNAAIRSPAEREVDELWYRVGEIEREYGGDQRQLALDTRYARISGRLRQLETFTPEEFHVMRALDEIDTNRIRPTAAEVKLLEQAKRIRDSKPERRMSADDRSYFDKIKKIESEMATAKQRAKSRGLAELKELNGSAYDFRVTLPDQTAFMKAFNIRNPNGFDENNYTRMEKMFRNERPTLLSDESREWLKREGEHFLRDAERRSPGEDPVRDAFLKRLRLYLLIDDANSLY